MTHFKSPPAELRAGLMFLVFCAMDDGFPSYTAFGRLYNNSARGHGKKLEAINDWCRRHGAPQLGVLVCEAGTSLPMLSGFDEEPYQKTYPGWDDARIIQEQRACQRFDWNALLNAKETEEVG